MGIVKGITVGVMVGVIVPTFLALDIGVQDVMGALGGVSHHWVRGLLIAGLVLLVLRLVMTFLRESGPLSSWDFGFGVAAWATIVFRSALSLLALAAGLSLVGTNRVEGLAVLAFGAWLGVDVMLRTRRQWHAFTHPAFL